MRVVGELFVASASGAIMKVIDDNDSSECEPSLKVGIGPRSQIVPRSQIFLWCAVKGS